MSDTLPPLPDSEHMLTLERLSRERCPIGGHRVHGAAAMEWALSEIKRARAAIAAAQPGKAALDAARMAGVHSVHAQTAVIVRAALELLEAVEGSDAFPPEKMAAFRRVFGGEE